MKRLRINKGSALVDYIIPTAVVGLVVGLALFTLQNDNLLTNFIAASSGSDVSTDGATLSLGKDTNTNDSQWVTKDVVDASVASGSSPELEDGEEISCAGGVCTIKVGDYVLTSVPENMAEYVSGTGPAGGQDAIAAAYKQIIEQMKAEADPDQSDLLAAIIDLADNIGQVPTNSVNYQKASNNHVLESIISNTYNSDSGIEVSGNLIKDVRTLDGQVDLTNPDILFQVKTMTGNTSTDFISGKIAEYAATASGINGKDYTALVNTLNYLEKQANTIDTAFLDEVSSQASGTNLAALQAVNLQSVKDNVASKLEDVTAASIIAAAKGEI